MSSTTRSAKRPLLALAAVGLVALEVFVIVLVAKAVGWWVVAMLLATSIVGGWLVKREGMKTFTSLRTRADAAADPAGRLGDAAVVLVGGLMILLPGFVTDLLGIVFVLPPVRPFARRVLTAVVGSRFENIEMTMPQAFRTADGYGGAGDSGPQPTGSVVEGRVVTTDDE